MKKMMCLLPILGMLFTACEKKETPTSPPPPNPSASYTSDADRDLDTTTAKETSPSEVYPEDQADSYADRPWLRKIRQALEEDKNLEAQAKNIEIAIVKGTIYLRGTVPNEKAKADVVKKVKQIVGDRKVEDQIEISK